MLFGSSAIAETRHRNATGSWQDADRDRRQVITEGRVTQLSRQNDGYRVRLDRGDYWYHVPQSVLGSRGNGFAVGVSVRLGGYYDSRGYVHVSSADWLDNDHYRGRRDDRDDRYRDRDRRGDRRDDFISGVVERVDRRGTILIRDQRTGRRVTAVMARGNNRRGVDLNDLRRGDRVTLRGDWERGGVFEVHRIEDIRSGRH
jgi:hypothetical protein